MSRVAESIIHIYTEKLSSEHIYMQSVSNAQVENDIDAIFGCNRYKTRHTYTHMPSMPMQRCVTITT